MKLGDFVDKIKKADISWKKAAPIGGVVFGVLFFIALSIVTMNDTENKRAAQMGIVTRFPTDTRFIFDETAPESGIVLSWYDNTTELKDGVAQSLKLEGALYPITIKDRNLTFESSDTECAEIDSDGNIIAKKPGSVEFIVKNEFTGITAKAYLQIIQPVEGFYIKNSAINLYITDTGARIEPVIYPENSTNSTI